jgi:hypothetical protein
MSNLPYTLPPLLNPENLISYGKPHNMYEISYPNRCAAGPATGYTVDKNWVYVCLKFGWSATAYDHGSFNALMDERMRIVTKANEEFSRYRKHRERPRPEEVRMWWIARKGEIDRVMLGGCGFDAVAGCDADDGMCVVHSTLQMRRYSTD